MSTSFPFTILERNTAGLHAVIQISTYRKGAEVEPGWISDHTASTEWQAYEGDGRYFPNWIVYELLSSIASQLLNNCIQTWTQLIHILIKWSLHQSASGDLNNTIGAFLWWNRIVIQQFKVHLLLKQRLNQKKYLFGLCHNLRIEAGLKGIFALHVTLFAFRLIFTYNRAVITDGCLEVIVRQRWVAILEGVLEHSPDKLYYWQAQVSNGTNQLN